MILPPTCSVLRLAEGFTHPKQWGTNEPVVGGWIEPTHLKKGVATVQLERMKHPNFRGEIPQIFELPPPRERMSELGWCFDVGLLIVFNPPKNGTHPTCDFGVFVGLTLRRSGKSKILWSNFKAGPGIIYCIILPSRKSSQFSESWWSEPPPIQKPTIFQPVSSSEKHVSSTAPFAHPAIWSEVPFHDPALHQNQRLWYCFCPQPLVFLPRLWQNASSPHVARCSRSAPHLLETEIKSLPLSSYEMDL